MLKGFLSVMFLFFLAISVCSILWVSNAEHAQQNAQQNTSGHSPLTQRRNHVCRAIYKCRKSLGANEPKAWNRKSGWNFPWFILLLCHVNDRMAYCNFFLFEIVFHDILKSIVFEMPCWARLRSVATLKVNNPSAYVMKAGPRTFQWHGGHISTITVITLSVLYISISCTCPSVPWSMLRCAKAVRNQQADPGGAEKDVQFVGKDARRKWRKSKKEEFQALFKLFEDFEFEDFAEKNTFKIDASCSLSTLSNTEDAAPPGVPGLDCRVDLRENFSVSLFINESWHIMDEGMPLRLAFL